MKIRPVPVALISLLTFTTLVAGCAKPSRAELRFFADPFFPEQSLVRWNECWFRLDAGGDFHIAARQSTSDADGAPLTRLLDIHVYWRSLPGKTPDNATSSNSTVRLAEMSEQGARLYTGAAFVYIDKIDRKRPRDKAKSASLELCELKPAMATGQPPADRGVIRMSGDFFPRWDDNAALAIAREIETDAQRVARP